MDEALEAVALPGQLEGLLGAADVDRDGRLQALVEADGGGRVEDDVDAEPEELAVRVGDAETGQAAVAPYGDDLVAELRLAGEQLAEELGGEEVGQFGEGLERVVMPSEVLKLGAKACTM